MKGKISFSTIYGLLFSLVGIAVGAYIVYSGANEDYDFFFVWAGLGGFLTAWSLSKLFLDRNDKLKISWFFQVSFVVGLLSHWTCWLLLWTWVQIDYWVFDNLFVDYSMDEPDNFFYGFLFAPLFGLFSWAFYGWVTVPLSILTVYLSKPLYERLNEITTANE